ncbi:hypothetical protein ACFLU6_10750 [Acidobacteriota bacterium]
MMAETEHGDDRLLREESLRFFGKISASFSHEINNAISIIAEYSGLLADLLAAGEQGAPLASDRIKEINQKIMNRAKKGEAIIKRFNKFSHSSDYPSAKVDLVEICDNLIALTQRLTSRKGLKIDTDFPSAPVWVNTNPFCMQMALFLCLEAVMMLPDQCDSLTVAVFRQEHDGRIAIRNIPSERTERVEEKLSLARILMDTIGGRMIGKDGREGNGEIDLHFPEEQHR